MAAPRQVSTEDKQDSYAHKVASRIIEQLEQGTSPLQQRWEPGQLQLPMNPTTQKRYRGMNALWLHMEGRSDPRWMTYKQAAAAEAQVRKGEKGVVIQYVKSHEEKVRTDSDGKPVFNADGKPDTVTVALQRPRLFSAVVFNAEQIDGLAPLQRAPSNPEWERHARAEAALVGSGVPIRHEPGEGAYYQPAKDLITLPARDQFASADAYYSVALHELGHATGHPSRLSRDLSHPFGSPGYAKEELRAEIASLMLGEHLELGYDPGQHVAYVESWIKALKDDPREIFRAAADAEKIVGFVMALEQGQEQQQAMVSEHSVAAPGEARTPSSSDLMKLTERKNLTVSFQEKDSAKAAGAQWDKEQKTWFAPPGSELSKFTAWLPGNAKGTVDEPDTPEQQFADACAQAGLILPGPPKMDGTWQRVPVEGDRDKQTSGTYRAYLDGRPAGVINNFKTKEQERWKAVTGAKKLSDAERSQLHDEAVVKLAAREAALKVQHARVATAVEELVAAATDAQADAPPVEHPYMTHKGLPGPCLVVPAASTELPEGNPIRIAKNRSDAASLRASEPQAIVVIAGDLLIPLHDIDGNIKTAQTISATGSKAFIAGGDARGAMHMTMFPASGKGPESPIVIGEGYATLQTIGTTTGATVVAAMTAGNLHHVATAIREKYPDRPILIAGDNDHGTAREIDPRTGLNKANRGLEAATAAAAAVGGHVAVPHFSDPKSKGTDWNDFLKEEGEESLQAAMAGAMLLADRRNLADAHRLGHDAERIAQDITHHQAQLEVADGQGTGVELSGADAKSLAAALRNAADREVDRQDKSDELGNGQPELEADTAEPAKEKARSKGRSRSVGRAIGH